MLRNDAYDAGTGSPADDDRGALGSYALSRRRGAAPDRTPAPVAQADGDIGEDGP